jgi:peptidyl-dipeptidase Dcp
VLEERMAESPEKINTFSKDLLEKQNQLPKKICRFNDFHKTRWTRATREMETYYSEKLKQELFSLDDEKLKLIFN